MQVGAGETLSGGAAAGAARAGVLTGVPGHRRWMFFFFSNRLGCLGSLLVSLVVTALLVLLFIAVF
ncbi:hypothetical protein [Modestobacter sp. SYSU DS0290]